MSKTQDESQPLLTLDQLAELLPKPDAHLRASLVEENTRAQFVAQGREIASSRIIIDEQSLYNQAYQFLSTASADQKETLVGCTLPLLAIAVDEARKLMKMSSGAGEQQQAVNAQTAASNATAARTYASSAALRNQAVTVLGKVAAHDVAWTTRINAAHANADLPAALGELAATGDAMLADKKSAVHARATLHGMTASFLGRLRKASTDATSASNAHVGRRRPVTQGALDLEDGINLHILGAFIDTFDAAHDIDTTIPRLVPISTRHILAAHHATKATNQPGPTTPAAGPTGVSTGPTTPSAGPTT